MVEIRAPQLADCLNGVIRAGGIGDVEDRSVVCLSVVQGLLLSTITAHPARPLAECLADAIGVVRSLHEDVCDLVHRASPSSTVVAVRAGVDVLEYLVLGDSSLLLAGKDAGATVVSDRRLDDVGKRLRGPVDALPTGSPQHAAALAEYRDALTGLRNRPGGFWIAGPDPHAAEHALTGAVPLGSLSFVTLLSDGATRLVDRFELATWEEALAFISSTDADELIRRVRQAEADDLEGRRWPRGKVHDDATVLHWVLT
ncbi:integrase [Streptomyces sp. NPDC058335]|uniref:integrase n=1 Tax=Streptomyces sp. NPDC058335 TaxID=3346451 RepID=UPI003646B479